MRMDKYNDNFEEEKPQELSEPTLSRAAKNQEMYREVYMNSSYVDINNLFEEKEEEEEKEEISVPTSFEEKVYDVNDYIKKAHERHTDDEALRNLDDEKFLEREYEIRKLIADIEEKDVDFLSELRGDDEDTLIDGKLKTDEFDTSVYESLQESRQDIEDTLLEKALGDETVVNLEEIEDSKLDHTFQKIMESDQKKAKKIKKLPIIVFSILLFILICVIIVIILI